MNLLIQNHDNNMRWAMTAHNVMWTAGTAVIISFKLTISTFGKLYFFGVGDCEFNTSFQFYSAIILCKLKKVYIF